MKKDLKAVKNTKKQPKYKLFNKIEKLRKFLNDNSKPSDNNTK